MIKNEYKHYKWIDEWSTLDEKVDIELEMEVKDLEEQIKGLEEKINEYYADIEGFKRQIMQRSVRIARYKEAIEKLRS